MTQVNDSSVCVPRFLDHVREALRAHPRANGAMTMTQCPGVLDVMGGIGEDSGSLVLTATMAMSFLVSAWQTAQAGVRLRLLIEGGQGPSHDFFLPPELLGPRSDAAAIMDRCRHADCEWAAPSCLVLQEAVSESLISPPAKGLMILLQTDFPTDADFGRHGVQAAATLDALCKLFSHQADRLQQSRACAAAVAPVTGLCSVRTAMTALCAPPGGALLQLRFHTPLVCQPLELPPGIMVLGARTRLTRPTSADRLIETCTCTEMGRRMIIDLQRRDGEAVNEAAARLSAISPTEYVERYRDRLPSKITGKAFVAKFGALRGLNGQLDPDEVYKVRSRAEHHIYENRRVQEFAAGITRARRTGSVEALAQAGELMYASHWSHSQRCGIGGVEPDQLVAGIRKHGHAAGLFGAKVTAGGAGGELVVLMRDNAQARAALADAIAKAEAASEHRIHTWRGWLAGADYFHPPKLEDVAAAVGAA